MAVEAELKFICAGELPADLSPIWSAVAVKVEPRAGKQLLNAYYDTADQWFRRQDAGLRTRLQQGRYEQTIKLAGRGQGALQVRPEYNLPCASVWPELNAFPAEVWPQGVDSSSLQQQLVQLFNTDFYRQSWLLHLACGAVVEVALDKGWVKAAGQQETIDELELELMSGDTDALFALGELLLRRLPLRFGVMSKAERGYRLNQQQPVEPTTAKTTSPGAVLKAVLYNEACWWQQQNQQALELLQQQWAALADDWPDFRAFLVLPPAQVLSSQAYLQAQLNLSRHLSKD